MADLSGLASVSQYFDGNWLDAASLLCAMVYAGHRRNKTNPTRKIICKDTGVDIANGVGIFPLFVLSLASISSMALAKLLESNKLILSVAGIVALLAILED
ncbi:MAG TPA: hypothetical protein VEH76_04515 [Methylocystis sp.]|nr:hypothetical protein [Methylocystis sp.]